MFKTLSELPIAIHETDKPTLHPKDIALSIVEKSCNREWAIAHFDQSLSFIDNIKRCIMIQSDNRIIFSE